MPGSLRGAAVAAQERKRYMQRWLSWKKGVAHEPAGGQFRTPGGKSLRSEAREREKRAGVIRKILEERASFSLD